jgi:hypothetical protein
MTEKITREMFAEGLNTKFKVRLESSDAVELELKQLTEGIITPTQEQFALLFHGPQNPFLQQAIYHVEHDNLGELDLFLVPVGRDQNGFQYEAVFNRFLEVS